jgi:hypothetical protein
MTFRVISGHAGLRKSRLLPPRQQAFIGGWCWSAFDDAFMNLRLGCHSGRGAGEIRADKSTVVLPQKARSQTRKFRRMKRGEITVSNSPQNAKP